MAQRILIAEDNVALSSVLRFSLEAAGFEVEVARNGRIAWEMFQESAFDLLITDQQMPEMTGTELCQKITEAHDAAPMPIVLLTAKGMELDLSELSKSLGISAAYPKPFSPAQIVEVVNGLLSAAPQAS